MSCRIGTGGGARLVVLSILLSGCSPRLTTPAVDSAASEAAITEYDGDGDGAIGGQELTQVPALKSALQQIDSNGDGQITADEIKARIGAWRDSRIALTQLLLSVRLDGRPLPGAQVTIVPEKFLGPAVKPAQGKTDERGMVNLKISDERDESGVHLGFYRIEVSKKSGEKETIPERYNSQSILGIEVAPDNPSVLGPVTVDVKSR